MKVKILFNNFKRFLIYVLLFFFIVSVVLSIPAVQTRIANKLTNRLNETYHTAISIEKVNLSFLGSVEIKGVKIRDHHKDTLIFVDKLRTSVVNIKKIVENNVNLGSISLEGVHFYMKNYKDESKDNLAVFIDLFTSDKPKDSLKPFALKSSDIFINDLTYKIINQNKENPLLFAVYNTGGSISDFEIEGENIKGKIRGVYFRDDRNLEVTNLTTDYSYSNTQMLFQNTTLQTKTSKLNAEITFNYQKEDLKDFNNKVKINALFKNSKLSLFDLRKIYGEIDSYDILNFNGNLQGTLNNFKIQKFDMYSNKGMRVVGDMDIKNAVDKNAGFVFDGDFKNITTNSEQIKKVLPNLLGKSIPSELSSLGNFSLEGKTYVDTKKMEALLKISTEIGTAISDIEFSQLDNITNTSYRGEIQLNDFHLGKFLNNSLLGKISLSGDIYGTGFNLENVNTTIIGMISKLKFNDYTYQNISVNGLFKNKLFNGDFIVNDEHLKMNFQGLADFSSLKNKFDFKAKISEANLVATNIFTRDSIAQLKGVFDLDAVGNDFDDMVGKTTFTDVVYASPKQVYEFKEFEIVSSQADSVKTIKFTSKDIINGQLRGYFKFNQLLPITQNALGSIYANYNPYKVEENQFVEFDFDIYNQIVDVFFPKIFIGSNTKIRGRIKSKDNAFKLNFISPKVIAYDNDIDTLRLRMDNKNPLFNTHFTAAKIHTKYYDLSKLNLLNRTKNDTLFFKSEFKDIKGNKETFNMDFFYTFNEDKKSVLGIEESTFDLNNSIWKINPNKDKDNKIIFDFNKSEYEFRPFQLVSNEQKLNFKGIIKDSLYKDVKFDFSKVKLENILPKIDSLKINGILDGELNFIQKRGIYSPSGELSIANFKVNELEQGDLDLKIKGENSYQKYAVDLNLKKNNISSISANGYLNFYNRKPTIDLSVLVDQFELRAFSPLGGTVLSNIRGNAYGAFKMEGALGNPKMKGELLLHNAGIKFPYLNVDYDFKGLTKIKLQEQSFVLQDIKLSDVAYKTNGLLKGNISHKNFGNWHLNLSITGDDLLALNTKETEDASYYGTAFINGSAQIFGLTSALKIDVKAKTNSGTKFIIPINDLKTVDNYRLIHFNTPKLREIDQEELLRGIEGLRLRMNLEVTNKAVAKVVLDKSSGSAIEGRGAGNFLIDINTKGRFRMNGDFTVDSGKYDFNYAGLISRTFNVQKGGIISWNGNPLEAELDIVAVYTTQANPAGLLENINTKRKIPIELITRISGGLFNSKQEFDIKIPNTNNAIATELELRLNDNNVNEKSLQFFSLLANSSFFNPNAIDFDSSKIAISTASNALSNVLSDIISSGDGKFQVNLGYDVANKSDIENLNTDDLVNVSVGTQISDRVIFNGKVGVPVGAKSQSRVIGEVKAEILINKSGTFRGVVFNRQNEIQYSNEEEGYTQGIGLTYQVNFNTLSELLTKLKLRENREKAPIHEKDSIFAPKLTDRVKFKNKTN